METTLQKLLIKIISGNTAHKCLKDLNVLQSTGAGRCSHKNSLEAASELTEQILLNKSLKERILPSD